MLLCILVLASMEPQPATASSKAAAAAPVPFPPGKRSLRGSFIKLEDMSGRFRAEFREYPSRRVGADIVCGFPALHFDG